MSNLVPASLSFDTSILAGHVGPSSLAMYERDFKAYLAYAATPEMAVQSSTLARWRTHLALETQLSPNTINRMMSAVKRLMKEAATQGYTSQETALAFERVEGVKIAALKNRTKPHARTRISPDEMTRLTATPGSLTLRDLRDTALLHTLASSGLRVSELASLTIPQIIQRDNGYLLRVMGKNETEYQDAHLSPVAYNAIQRWIQARGVTSLYVFTAFNGRGVSRLTDRPMTTVAVWQTVKAYAVESGLSEQVTTHDLRRFVGTQLAKTDIRKAQKALRHKRIETTARHYVLDDIEVGLTDNLYQTEDS